MDIPYTQLVPISNHGLEKESELLRRAHSCSQYLSRKMAFSILAYKCPLGHGEGMN